MIAEDSEYWLKSEALELGFDDVGVTSSDPHSSGARLFDEWIELGRHGSMNYLERSRDSRADPQYLLPGAKSVILTLTRYQAAKVGPRPIAAYATREDYHRVLKMRLNELAKRIDVRFAGSLSRPCVDTAPLLEKAFASRAGLGWIGKSTNLIHERLGCHTLIGAIITTAELKTDTPSIDRCGTCTRCLDACPTHAFPAPYQLDATRCLSYWTIEHRGPIPDSFHRAQGSRIFGCDDCLTACPFGHKLRENPSPAIPTDTSLAEASWLSLLEEGHARFKKTFGNTAVPRALKRGFLRNALIAAKNEILSRGGIDEETAKRLTLILNGLVEHEDETVRMAATQALESLPQ